MLEKGSVFRVVLGLATALLVHASAEAQTADGETAVSAGSRVRVTYDGPDATEDRITGDLRALGPESLNLAVRSSDEREIPLRSIVRLERRVQKGRKTRGALIGFGVGFSTLFLLTELGGDETCFRGGDECALQVTASAVLALPAALVGAMVAPGDQWTEIPLDPAPVRPSSVGRGLELRLVPVVGKTKGITLVGSFRGPLEPEEGR